MSALLQAAALLCTALGLLSAGIVLAALRDVRLGLKVLLEFLLAAGLLRLTDDPSWSQLAVAAIVVVLRRLLTRQL